MKNKEENIKQEKIEVPNITQRKGLVLKISLLYLLLTMFTILIFGIGTFGNQLDKIKIINEASAEKLTGNLVTILKSIPPSKKYKKNKKKITAIQKAIKRFELMDLHDIENYILLDFNNHNLYDDNDNLIYEHGSEDGIANLKQDLDKLNEFREVLNAKQNKAIYNQDAHFKFDNEGKTINVFIPFSLVKGTMQVFVTSFHNKAFSDKKDETYRLFAFLIGFIILMQILFGFFIYRMLIYPIRRLQSSALKIADGNFLNTVTIKNKNDELETLAESFNFMGYSLNDMTEKLKGHIKILENHAEIVRMELNMASAIQLGMLPGLEDSERFKIGHYYEPLATVSGDYYDIFELPKGNLGFLIADASGHGIPAALVTILAKSSFSTRAHLYPNPPEFLTKINSLMCDGIATSDYMTAFYFILTPENRMIYTNASHNRIMIHRKMTNSLDELDTDGFILGSLDELPLQFTKEETQLEIGDRIILYTDGIPESKNNDAELYSYERFKENIITYSNLSPQELVDRIIHSVDEFTSGYPRSDDYTLICIEIKSKG